MKRLKIDKSKNTCHKHDSVCGFFNMVGKEVENSTWTFSWEPKGNLICVKCNKKIRIKK